MKKAFFCWSQSRLLSVRRNGTIHSALTEERRIRCGDGSEVTNTAKSDADGEILRIPVRELGLAGTPSREIRVVDAEGRELLYALRPSAETVAEDAELLVPVRAGAGKSTHLWVYYGNPAAWPVPDELLVSGMGFSDSFENGSDRLPPGWNENSTDALHRNFRSGSVARTGGKSLETRLESGAKPNWVKFFRTLPVRPGTRYTIRGWVKGENVKGGVGAGYFQLHWSRAAAKRVTAE